jgi:hypothetical protein
VISVSRCGWRNCLLLYFLSLGITTNQNVKKEIDEAPGPWYLWDIELDREMEAAILRLEIEAKAAHDAALVNPNE